MLEKRAHDFPAAFTAASLYNMSPGSCFFRSMPQSCLKLPDQVSRSEMAHRVFSSADFSDLCEDAGLLPVMEYIYGCTALRLPEEWKASIRAILDGSFEL